ncbi:LD-carboxypeptidase [Polaribacter sp.]|nr:LD-carboxypeptidase [Polaribacter sp.]
MKEKPMMILKKLLLFFILFSISAAIFSQDNLQQPSSLKIGDTIAIVAPAGILKNRTGAIYKAKQTAESWGLHVVIGKNIYKNGNHFAGTDQERTADFQKALNDKSIKAIWCARGGYGSVRILDKLDFSTFLENPKWVIGYSDITAFHNHIHNLGVATIHGMMPTSFEFEEAKNKQSIASLKNALFGKKLHYQITSSQYNRTLGKTKIEGQIIGGNLSIVTSMLGSKSQINTKNKILFLEEIGEYKYAIDRLLQSLKRAGYFDDVNAIIIGNMSNVKKNKTLPWGSSIKQLILDVVPKNIPVLFNFPAGHEIDNRAMIFGGNVQLKIEGEQWSMLFDK